MESRDFTYWLQGYAELCGDKPDEKQWAMIKEHLGLVFEKVTSVSRETDFNIQYCLGNVESVHLDKDDVIEYRSGQYPYSYPLSGDAVKPFLKNLQTC